MPPVYRWAMSDAEKKARLAEALRANLRKRKAQSREQTSREGAANAAVGAAGDSAKSEVP